MESAIAGVLEEHRRRARMEISELSSLSKVSRTTIYAIRDGKMLEPSLRVLRSLAVALATDAITDEVDQERSDSIAAELLIAAGHVTPRLVYALARHVDDRTTANTAERDSDLAKKDATANYIYTESRERRPVLVAS